MLKNTKIGALCLIAPLICLGCGNNPNRGKDKLLERKTYNKIATVLSGDIIDGLSDAYDNQIHKEDNHSVFDIPNNATIIENIDMAFSGSLRLIIDEQLTPIEFNNLNAEIDDQITTAWNISRGYAKFTDSLGGVNYVIKDADDSYWKCFPNDVLGQKYRINITDFLRQLGGGSPADGFKNYLLIESAKNLGDFTQPPFSTDITDKDENMIDGYGLDITGFGGDNFNEGRDIEQAKIQYGFHNVGIGKSIGRNYEMIDEFIDDLAIDIKQNTGADLIHDYTFNENNKSNLSINYGFTQLDFKKLAKVLNESLLIKPYYQFEASGEGMMDYFVSYESSFIHQQELVIHVKDTDFAMYPKHTGYLVDAKKVTINGVINESLERNTCTVEKVDLADFKIVE